MRNLAEANKINEIFQQFKKLRGEVIEGSLALEDLLSEILSRFLGGQDRERRKLTRILFLDTGVLTFAQKRFSLNKILRLYGSRISCLTTQEEKELVSKLWKFIVIRNKFAHGIVVIDGASLNIIMKYHHNGDDKVEEIPENAVQEILTLQNFIWDRLYELNEWLKNAQL